MADASQARAHGRVGSVVRGKYRVEAFLAAGTMANVYAATHRNGSRVALKILHRDLALDPALAERFRREGYFANSIGHPGIIRAIDDDETEDGCAFLVMELLEGETLEEKRRRKGGKLPLHWVLGVADTLLDILAAAHAREVLHRDLKPDNVFITNEGEVKVLDFGVARWNDGKSSSDMTGVGMVLGTPAYMPPEQALGRRQDVDAQSDLWGVGATLFVVLSGETVHEGGDAKAKLIATARTPARPLADVAPHVPRAVAAVIDRALAFDKRDRWPDARAMREALRWARMSVEQDGRPEGSASEGSLEAVPPPVPTRRTMDDEPTITRAAPSTQDDVMTSAPPITLRDVPRIAPTAAAPHVAGVAGALSVADPVFSLRRPKGDDEPLPSTQRLPADATGDDATGDEELSRETRPSADTAAALASTLAAKLSPAVRTAPGIGAPPDLSAAGPADARGSDLSFTRPMAALVMPSYPAPRPAAGDPPPQPAAGDPPPAIPEGFPFGAAPRITSSPPPPLASAPPAQFASAPPAQFASAPPAYVVSSPPQAPLHVSPPPEGTPRGRTYSLPPEAPGPVLSQIVERRSRLPRILFSLLVLGAAAAAIVFVIRRRAVQQMASAATRPAVTAEQAAPSASTATPGAAASAATAGSAAGATASAAAPASAAPIDDAKLAAAGVVATATASAVGSATVEHKRPPAKPRRKPRPPTTTAAATAAAPPAPGDAPPGDPPPPGTAGPSGPPPSAPPEPPPPAPAPAPAGDPP